MLQAKTGQLYSNIAPKREKKMAAPVTHTGPRERAWIEALLSSSSSLDEPPVETELPRVTLAVAVPLSVSS